MRPKEDNHKILRPISELEVKLLRALAGCSRGIESVNHEQEVEERGKLTIVFVMQTHAMDGAKKSFNKAADLSGAFERFLQAVQEYDERRKAKS